MYKIIKEQINRNKKLFERKLSVGGKCQYIAIVSEFKTSFVLKSSRLYTA